MKFEIKDTLSGQVIVFCATEEEIVPSDLNLIMDGMADHVRPLVDASRFRGKAGQTFEITPPPRDGLYKIILLGLGPEAKITELGLEQAGGTAFKKLASEGYTTLTFKAPGVDNDIRLLSGARLASYRFDTYMTKLKEEQKPSVNTVSLVVSDVASATSAYEEISASISGTELARDLMNEPPNILNPETYAEKAKELEALGVKVSILGEKELADQKMTSMLGVGQGSVIESKMVVMEWSGGDDEAPLALVGKGVTFDTGGISLKPGNKMEDMKGDMGGSAAVVGAMKTLALRKAKANVVGLIGLVENMPDGNAQRPGDIVSTMSGQTVEIQNTDAEGRLVLCDVLWYAQEIFKPKAVIDLATLTGAIISALGHDHAGLFSNNDELSMQLAEAGLKEGEPVWRLPLSPKYDRLLKSQFADMKNIGGPAAGSITAAQFLQRFIKDGTPWVHLDIAGVAWKSGEKEPTDPSWASGYGPRILNRLVKDNFEST